MERKCWRQAFGALSSLRARHLGFAFFWAWMSLFMYRSASSSTAFDPQIPLLTLTVSSTCMLVIVAFVYPRKAAPLSAKPALRAAASALVVAGTLLCSIPVGEWGVLAGAILAGMGMILIMIMWGEFYGSVGAFRASLYMPLSLLGAVALYGAATAVPVPIEVALMCAYPIAAVLLVVRNEPDITAKERASSANASAPTRDGSSGCILLPWKIVLAAGLYGAISGLVSSTSYISGEYTGLVQVGNVVIAVLLVLGVLFLNGGRAHEGFTYKPTLFVMIAGCVALVLSESFYSQMASVVINGGYMLFYALSWIMYADVSYRLNLPSYKVFSSGRLFGAFGYAVGMAAGFAFTRVLHVNVQRPEVLAAITMGLVLFTAVFVLDEKDVASAWGRKPSVPPALSGLASLAVKAGLTPRESEVLELLAKGRSMPYIEEALHISYSTVNSHTASIYQKLGVHSKQELISLVERESEGTV